MQTVLLHPLHAIFAIFVSQGALNVDSHHVENLRLNTDHYKGGNNPRVVSLLSINKSLKNRDQVILSKQEKQNGVMK